jgi:hypothetical protein
MLERLDRLGRCGLDMVGSGVDWAEVIKNCIVPFHSQAVADPVKFLSDLTTLIEHDTGGFATYGAVSLMYELVDASVVRSPVGAALLYRGIDFKIQRGLPPASFTGYESERYVARNYRQQNG